MPPGLTDAFLTALLFLGVQQLEGDFATPKIQGDTLHLHPVLVFLAVIVDGGLYGIFGVIVAVPALAVLRVLFDFFRVRLETHAQREIFGAWALHHHGEENRLTGRNNPSNWGVNGCHTRRSGCRKDAENLNPKP